MPKAKKSENVTKSNKKKTASSKKSLYTMEVFITSGPVSEEFLERNPVISRTIVIRGDQTLDDLHDIIFDAFDRFDPHMYEFQIGGKGPNDTDARKYAVRDPDADGDASKTTIDSLGLAVGDAFGYWFDFGDDWWHQVNVISIIKDNIPEGRYPEIIKEVGESPPQYEDE